VSCGGASAAERAANVDLSTQAIIAGTVTRDGRPVTPAYVRLLDRSGEFTAEVPTGKSGDFRFHAGPGEWTVLVLAARTEPVQASVHASTGAVTEVRLTL
jgi:hypothetical protein